MSQIEEVTTNSLGAFALAMVKLGAKTSELKQPLKGAYKKAFIQERGIDAWEKEVKRQRYLKRYKRNKNR